MRITVIAFAVGIVLVIISLGSPIGLAVADNSPKLNAGPSCDAAARGAISPGSDKEVCMGDEREAEAVLTKTGRSIRALDVGDLVFEERRERGRLRS